MTTIISSTTAITAVEIILLSNLRCIKMRKTNEDFTAAIKRAMATVKVPSEICVTATEIRVKQIKPARTKRNVL
jgi:hypothetical protein